MTRFFKIASVITMALLDLNSGVSPIFAADLPLVFGHSETQKTGGHLTKVDAEMRLEEFAKAQAQLAQRGPMAAAHADAIQTAFSART
jgi:alpha-D-ribose 1-methylphosphonate 5-triphosphate synthase subunit PhnI